MLAQKRFLLICLILVLLLGFNTYSQDLGSIKKEDIVKVSGGLGLQLTGYTAMGMEAKREPFMWQLNLNMSINILGVINAPFSASISSQAAELSTPQPFNSFGISPKYKAVTLHLGYRSINLSEFSLSGSQFLGIGVEVKPKDAFVKGKVLWGRFAKPVFFNPDGTIATKPSYARYGWGTGITFGSTPKSETTVNIFKAKDDPNSLDVDVADIETKPADNLVLGISTKQEITKKISFDAEADISFYTNDLTVPAEVDQGNSYANNIFLFGYNGTSEFKKAIIGGINYKPDFAKFKLQYRRVDPGYRTLGTSFINNDYEDINLKTSFSLFDKKTGISLSGGVQRNNLNGNKASKLLRLIGSVAVSHTINEKWSASANFSNFSSRTRQTIVITFDSLQFVQTTKAAGFALTRSISNDNSNTSLNIAFNYQDAIVNKIRMTSFYNSNIGLQKQFLKSKLSVGASLVGMHNISETGTTSNIGPSAMMGTMLLKDKLQISLVAAYLPSYIDMKSQGSVSNISVTGSYAIFKKHKIAYSISDIIRNVDTGKNSELTATLSYSYSF